MTNLPRGPHGPLRTAVDRIWDGSIIISRRWARGLTDWVREAETLTGRLVRIACLAGLGWIGWRIIRAAPWIMWAVTTAWAAAAYHATAPPKPPKPPKKGAEKTSKKAQAEDHDSTPEDDAEEPLLTLLGQLIGDGRAVHLATVLDHLHKAGAPTTLGVPDLRTRLADLGVPVRPSVKVAGRVSVGVHRDDLTATPRPSAQDTA